jgi:putative NADH-flavin reductase
MKIALIGATGYVGAAVLTEALSRGHAVTVIARDPAKIAAQPGVTAVKADAYDAASVAAAVAGADAVISAFNPGWTDPEIKAHFLSGSQAIDAGVRASGVKRLLVVGGAGSLYVAPGVQLIDTPHFPKEYFEGADGARRLLALYRDGTVGAGLDWTFLSPPVFFSAHAPLAHAPRTGRYRVGGEAPLMDGETPAGISEADLAAAILDEIETPKHVRARFTVASA